MGRKTTITKQDLINDVHRVLGLAKNQDRVRVTDYVKHGAFSLNSINRMFGSTTNAIFDSILGMPKTDELMDASTLSMLTRKVAKHMGEEGIEINADTFVDNAQFDTSMLTHVFGGVNAALIAAGVLLAEQSIDDYLEDNSDSEDEEESCVETEDPYEDIEDIDPSDYGIVDIDEDDIGDDEAFYDAMSDSYEDEFYREEDFMSAKIELQSMFDNRW